MQILIDYIATYAPWIYFVCGVVALYQMYRTWLVRAERRQAVFSLEREKAVRDLGNIFSTAMLLLVVMGVTYFTSTTLVRALEPMVEEARSPSPEIDFVPTPTNTPLPISDAANSLPQLVPTVDPAATAETVTPTAEVLAAPTVAVTVAPPTATPAPIVQAPVCANGNSIILRPGTNETVRGVITVVGTASHPNLQYYKIEYAPAGTANWGYLAGDQNAVINGVLATIDTSVLGNGAWTLRLVVVDQTGNYPEPCQVTIYVEN
ncbi:MAG: hypothetical protein KDE19_21525 [Caldilineaceae bacterium]|nr:hypothetical protein [Caldilineaceae bacterium]